MSDPRPRVYRKDYRPPAWRIEQVELHFELALPRTRVRTRFTFQRAGWAGDDEALVLDGERFALLEIQLDGALLSADRYVRGARTLTIANPPARGELVVLTEVQPAASGMEGLVHVSDVFVSHCEPEGFRKITYFIDRPDVLARYRCTLVADPLQCPTLLSNGNLIASGQQPDGRHYATWEDPWPKASYLFALAAGRFGTLNDRFTTRSGRRVSLAVHAQEHELALCRHGMNALKRAMAWDEAAYGREYDLDVLNVAVIRSYPGGAMENKGLNLYSSEIFLASRAHSTDAQLQWIEAVVAHEYLHNWSGNRVGCRNWFELSLKEGFTIFRQQEFMAAHFGAAEARIDAATRIREFQFAEDEGGMAHAVRPDSYLSVNNLYTHTVYEKGAEVIRMMQSIVGEERFSAAAREFFRRYDGSATSIDALIDTVESVCDCDLAQFRRWYDVVGGLKVSVAEEYEPDRQRYTLTLSQSPATSDAAIPPLHVPVRIGLLDPEGQPLSPECVVHLRSEQERFVFEQIPAPPTPALFRGFSAPVRVESRLGIERLALLARFDSDPVTRWDAAQELVTGVLLQRADESEAAWLKVFARTLKESRTSAGLAARTLELPSERQLGRRQAVVDVEGLRRSREALAAATARRYRRELRAVCASSNGHERSEAEGYGERRLRNLCLWYLMHAPDNEDTVACYVQFQSADSMENTVAALRLLVARTDRLRDQALAEAYERWRHSPELIDQWFAIQAASEADDCAQRVSGLLRHPDWSLDNGARLKAFFDAFARNQSAFHDASGVGYEIVASTVINLNESNPRLAARLLKHLDGGARFDPARHAAIRRQLERVLSLPRLADDLYEIASRSLQAGAR